MHLVTVAGGKFSMGSIRGDADARPVHDVMISSFKIGCYLVQVSEFTDFVSESDHKTIAERDGGSYVWDGDSWLRDIRACWHRPGFSQSPSHPVTCISWYDAVMYCNWLSSKSGCDRCYEVDENVTDPNNHFPQQDAKWLVQCDFEKNGYRLPTEAEWEFAARGGVNSRGFVYAGSDDPISVGWYIDPAAARGTIVRTRDFGRLFNNGTPMPVGQKRPNEIGLYDMSGNLREWCWDWYGENYYREETTIDPKGPSSGAFRVSRGGSWQANVVDQLQTTHRNYGGPGTAFTNFGFRVVRPL